MTKHHHITENAATLAGGFSAAKFPAGLVDTNAEMFSDGESLKGTHKGQTKKFSELSKTIQDYFSAIHDKARHEVPEYESMLREHFKCRSYQEEVEQSTLCNYGGFDNKPDYYKKGDPVKEYWNCGHRGKCPAEGIVCKPDCIINNNLHLREVDVIKCLAAGMTDQEIADNLKIELSTARTHERNIREKLEFNHRGEIIRFAFRNNIIF